MLGYLDEPDATAEVMRDGWYVTGDIATIDEDGFIRITDRLSRFSKIARRDGAAHEDRGGNPGAPRRKARGNGRCPWRTTPEASD